MDLSYIAIVVLAAMIFVLTGMVGYLYWQQTRLLQQIQSLAIIVSTRIPPPAPPTTEEEEEEESVSTEAETDDRVEVVEGPPAAQPSVVAEETVDVDDIQNKTVKELHEILTKKGIPYGKRDSKPVLLQLLKATA